MNTSAQTLEQSSTIIEEWKPIKGYEGLYAISSFGRVESFPRKCKNRFSHFISKQKILRPRPNQKGYNAYGLCGRMFRANRLVAIHFIDNPHNLQYVNHKDGNKKNDHVSNLEWITAGDNERHAYRTGLKKAAYLGKRGKLHNQSKPVLAIKDTSILEFESKTECSEYFGVTIQNVCRALKFDGVCRGHKIYAI